MTHEVLAGLKGRLMTKRYAMCIDHRIRIKDSLPGRQKAIGIPEKDNRVFIYGVLYCYRAGSHGYVFQNALLISA